MSDWGATQRVAAEVVLADGVVLEGDLHLATSTAYHPETESPLEMLNRPEPFFALTLQQGEVAFVSKAQVAVVSCRDQLPLSDPARASAARPSRRWTAGRTSMRHCATAAPCASRFARTAMPAST